jgi:hypothetical protein
MCAPRVTRHIWIRYSSSCHTCVNICAYSSLLQWLMPLGQWGHVAMVGWILCTKCTLHSNHRLTVWYSNTQNDFSPGAAIFSLHTLAPPSGRNVNYDQKQLTGKNFLSCSFCLCRFHKYLSYGFPIINFCNPGVHYETPCIQWCNSLPCCIYVNQCQGFTILMQLYLYMFMFEYACDMAFIVRLKWQ